MGRQFSSINPATGETVWTGPAADAAAVDAAVHAARGAAETWGDTPLDERTRLLQSFSDQLKQHHAELIDAICRETGKPNWEAATEVESMITKIPTSIDALHRRRAQTVQSASGITSSTRYKPFGVVAVFGPFNFPGHLPNGHIAPALLAGNAVVFKPSEMAPHVADVMFDCWKRAGIPVGAINLIHGDRATGQLLVAHPGIEGVFFTGSFAGGRAINQALASQPGKVLALEMGGNNPLVIHNVSNLDAAAYLTIQSAYLTAGQRCSCARRLIVVGDGERFIDALVGMISRIRVGSCTDQPEPFIGPVISDAAADRLLAAQADLRSRGGKALATMQQAGARRAMLCPGLIDVTDVSHRTDEEFFGPLLQLIRVREFDDAIAEANRTQFGLAAGLLSDDRASWEKFHRKIRAGVVNWNRATTGASGALPFGGVGCSGNNRPSGYFAADYCSYPVATMESETLTMPATLTPGIDR
jgi:succinylglutamic semialdehyde dehydrogenase